MQDITVMITKSTASPIVKEDHFNRFLSGFFPKFGKNYAYDQFRFFRPNFKVFIVYMMEECNLFFNVHQIRYSVSI